MRIVQRNFEHVVEDAMRLHVAETKTSIVSEEALQQIEQRFSAKIQGLQSNISRIEQIVNGGGQGSSTNGVSVTIAVGQLLSYAASSWAIIDPSSLQCGSNLQQLLAFLSTPVSPVVLPTPSTLDEAKKEIGMYIIGERRSLPFQLVPPSFVVILKKIVRGTHFLHVFLAI